MNERFRPSPSHGNEGTRAASRLSLSRAQTDRIMMSTMSLEEMEQAAEKINNLARALEVVPNAQNVKNLCSECDYYRRQMQGRFWNVAPLLDRIMDAARLFLKSGLDLTKARADLNSAVEGMNIVIDLHRRA